MLMPAASPWMPEGFTSKVATQSQPVGSKCWQGAQQLTVEACRFSTMAQSSPTVLLIQPCCRLLRPMRATSTQC